MGITGITGTYIVQDDAQHCFQEIRIGFHYKMRQWVSGIMMLHLEKRGNQQARHHLNQVKGSVPVTPSSEAVKNGVVNLLLIYLNPIPTRKE